MAALNEGVRGKLRRGGIVSRLAACLVCIVLAAQTVLAHEIQPSVADLTFGPDAMTMDIRLTLEAPVAGIDLEGLFDTNDAANSDDYDRLRALDPVQMEAAFRRAWPGIRDAITIRAGETPVVPEIAEVEIPPVGNADLPRMSRLRLVAALPADGTDVVVGWEASLGALVVRQMGVEDGYTGYLTNGALSDPMPRERGAAMGWGRTFLVYVGIGFEHIVPKGLDHILFVLGLFFLSVKLRPLLWQVTAFTLAHTVTLALGTLGLVRVPAEIVEPLIAASIVYVGVENVLARGLSPWRPAVVFGFGLLHGLGFASVLGEIGLDPGRFATGLIGFNVGVELGQLAVIAVAFFGLGYWVKDKPWYRTRIANPASVAIAAVGAFWFFERTVF
jgi:hydrogenase/urease accessory protein HupE